MGKWESGAKTAKTAKNYMIYIYIYIFYIYIQIYSDCITPMDLYTTVLLQYVWCVNICDFFLHLYKYKDDQGPLTEADR